MGQQWDLGHTQVEQSHPSYWYCCVFISTEKTFITTQSQVSHWQVTESTHTFSTVSKWISMTWFALCRCFQFGSLCRARSRKCTSVLLLPGCCSQNTFDSRANIVTGSCEPVSPKPVCNHVSGEHCSAHMLAFMHDALHYKLIGTGIIILGQPWLWRYNVMLYRCKHHKVPLLTCLCSVSAQLVHCSKKTDTNKCSNKGHT